MSDPTPDLLEQALSVLLAASNERESAVERKLVRGAYAFIDSALAAQRALLAELLADHYARAHRTMDAHPEDECRVWAAQGMPGCQAPERTRRLGVEGEG